MLNYTHSHLWINSRCLLLKDIIEEKTNSRSEFETEVFTFLRQWANNQQEFTLHTSGSTGQPKLITINRDQMIASAKLTAAALELDHHHHALINLSVKYIAGKMMLVRCLVSNMKIFALDPCANPLYKIPIDQTIHFTALVPYQIKSILESKHPHLLNNMLTVIIGGAPLHETIAEKLKAFSSACYATYGMTETLTHVALQRINGERPLDYFETLPGIKISTDSRQCLVVKASYLKEDVVTNDLVEIIDDNKFRWLGRWDNIINTGGFKVLPENLERKIQSLFKRLNINYRFFIHSLPNKNLGSKIILVLEHQANNSPEWKDSLIESMQSLQPHEKPWEMHLSQRFILTETGKINRTESLKSVRLTFTLRK